jgi:hypothetical protein
MPSPRPARRWNCPRPDSPWLPARSGRRRRGAASDEVKQRLANEGAEALPGSAETYAADIDKEETKWGAPARKLGLKLK